MSFGDFPRRLFQGFLSTITGQPQQSPPPPPMAPAPAPVRRPSDPDLEAELQRAMEASLQEKSPAEKEAQAELLQIVLCDWGFLEDVLSTLPGVNPSDARFARFRDVT